MAQLFNNFLIVEKEVGLGKPQSQFFKGYVVSRSFDIVVVMREKQGQESVASCMFANFFSFHEGDSDLCGNVKMTLNIPKCTEL